MRDVKQHPFLTWEAAECAELRRLSWQFYRLRWLFWALQVLIVTVAWVVAAPLWERPPEVPLSLLSFGGFMTLQVMVIFLWPILKSRIGANSSIQNI